MHEEALLHDLRAEVDRLCASHPGERIVRARLLLGPLAHLDEPRLRALWSRAMHGGPAELATLEVVPGTSVDDPRAASIVLRSVTFEDGPTPAPEG